MTESQPPVQIHIVTPEDGDDADFTDVGVVIIGGERHLYLKPQSFETAVRQVRSALPDLPLEQVERLVREHSGFQGLDKLFGAVEQRPALDVTPSPEWSSEPVRPRGRLKRVAVAAAVVSALVGSWVLGYATGDSQSSNAASEHGVGSTPSATSVPGMQSAPFVGSDFLDFSKAGRIDCQPIANLQAECTDADGMVMSTKAATGPDSTIFTFSYGSQSIGLRIFYEADYASTWARQDGSRELYPHMKVHGRYVLWGTDKARIAEYMDLLRQADKDAGPSVRGGSTPLPSRLAALTLGTLGLNNQQVHQIIARPAVSTTDAPSMVAARLVLGLGTRAVYDDPEDDDIVALAIGVERPPAAGSGSTVLVTKPEPPVRTTTPAMPSKPTATPSTPSAASSTSSTPTTAPADTATTPPTETTSNPPLATGSAPSEPDGTATAPVEETPSATEMPAEETQAPSVDETPAPVETPAVDVTAPVQDDATETAAAPGQEGTAAVGTDDQDDSDDVLVLPSA